MSASFVLLSLKKVDYLVSPVLIDYSATCQSSEPADWQGCTSRHAACILMELNQQHKGSSNILYFVRQDKFLTFQMGELFLLQLIIIHINLINN